MFLFCFCLVPNNAHPRPQSLRSTEPLVLRNPTPLQILNLFFTRGNRRFSGWPDVESLSRQHHYHDNINDYATHLKPKYRLITRDEIFRWIALRIKFTLGDSGTILSHFNKVCTYFRILCYAGFLFSLLFSASRLRSAATSASLISPSFRPWRHPTSFSHIPISHYLS